MKNTTTALFFLANAFLFLFSSCKEIAPKQIPDPLPKIPIVDYLQIKEKGTLTLLTENTSLSYFIYRGNPIGYDYEMVRLFCEEHKLDLKVIVLDDLNNMFDELNNNEGDIIACNLTITPDRDSLVNFTNPILKTNQVLVQRKASTDSTEWIDSIEKLDHKTIVVHEYSSFHKQLLSLESKYGIDINIVKADGSIDTEELIRDVMTGKIDYTVTDENYAQSNATYYRNLDHHLTISLPQSIGWAVRKSSDSLLVELNSWLSDKRNKKDISYLQDKYYKFKKSHRKKVKSPYSSLSGSKISIFDKHIKSEAKKLDWNWKLLAALINKESGFDSTQRSWAGAFGLMQLMPETGEKYNIDTTQTGKENITAGVKYVKYLNKYWKKRINNKEERIKFVLASYNAGLGHVEDARALALHVNKSDTIFDDHVSEGLKMKTEKQYYKLDIVKNGFCRGYGVIRYVNDILKMSESYLLIKEE